MPLRNRLRAPPQRHPGSRALGMTVQSDYVAPLLAAEIVAVRDGGAARLVLQGRGREAIIDVEGDVDSCARLLDQLRRDQSYLQSSLRGETSAAAVELARELDQLGWIADADRSGEDALANTCLEVASIFDDASRWLAEMGHWSRAQHGIDAAELARHAVGASDLSLEGKGRSQLLLSVLVNSWRETASPSGAVFL